MVCKIIERLIHDKLEEHTQCNNLLSKKQLGFIKGSSTALQLFKVTDDWTKLLKWVMKLMLLLSDFKRHLILCHTKS
jgi:hypothetical protein